MKQIITNNFSIEIATTNGSGSLSANQILTKALFRLNLPVSGKNIFPSNIQGLPTWYKIRVNTDGLLAYQPETHIKILMNQQTFEQDIRNIIPGGVLIYNETLKIDPLQLRTDIINIAVPMRALVDKVSKGIKIKTFLMNMVYVGVLSRLLKMDQNILIQTVVDQFKNKESILEENKNALLEGWNWAEQHFNTLAFPYQVKPQASNNNHILIDGNTAAALGSIWGGCTFVAWYPITPASSLIENFEKFAQKYRKDISGKNLFACIQAEDELSAITMVTGAGWAGARAMTATSGPGLSLMAECAGLSYYAEIPAVIWDVQRAGPSTGLPTRTQQSDLITAAFLSHGDTKHILLIPSTPKECFDFAQQSLDLAEVLQTLVIVLSDLDLGMNSHTSPRFSYPKANFKRGKVLTLDHLTQSQEFARYADRDDDGIPYRTLPGTHHPSSAYFTRGTGHDVNAKYSENNETYCNNHLRLEKKWETAKTLVPKPLIQKENSSLAFVSYGSSLHAVEEARTLLKQKKMLSSHMQIKSFPFTQEVADFLEQHSQIYIVDLNRDGQMKQLLCMEYPSQAHKFKSICHFDGLPIAAQNILNEVHRE